MKWSVLGQIFEFDAALIFITMFIDSNVPVLAGQRAQIESEIFLGSNWSTCITFWYSMKTKNNPTLGTLNVLKYDLTNKQHETLWTLSQGQSSVWSEAKLTYTADHRHTIIFEAVKGLDVGDIALVSRARHGVKLQPRVTSPFCHLQRTTLCSSLTRPALSNR